MKNPPAFPIQGFSTRYGQGFQAVVSDGMSLRDYFAAKALPYLMSAYEDIDAVARVAYAQADAMLKAREA